MTPDDPMSNDADKVWRYMSFSRFVWLLQKKRLWLSRADRLGDPWEISLAGEQLQHVIARRPIPPIGGPRTESAIARSARIVKQWRQDTFVNCWNFSDHESHALWRIYCGSTDGVAIQTTFGKLQQSVGELPVYKVTYGIPGSRRQTPNLIDLVTKKRPMFAYEQEVRIVRHAPGEHSPDQEILGYALEWKPGTNLESIYIHPDADLSFKETVTATVTRYAPALKDSVVWSAMKEPPPF